MNPNRVRCLKPGEIITGPVVYWMSRDQQSHDNWALLYAQQQALQHQSQLRDLFSLSPSYLAAYSRQYAFMLQGLREVAADLSEKNSVLKYYPEPQSKLSRATFVKMTFPC